MDSKLYTVLNRLSVGLKCRVRIHSRPEEAMAAATGRVIGQSRHYYTSRKAKTSLYAKISPLGDPGINVKSELDVWVRQDKKVWVGELKRIIHDLRKHRRYSQALKVSEWMKERGICEFSPSEHAVQLDLTGRVHGLSAAESYFSSLPEQEKTDKTYGALLNCFVRKCETDKALSHFQKMKEMGFVSSSLTYNDIMCLYLHTDQLDKVPEVLAEMKENKVSPDNYSYRICISSFGNRSDIEGMENMLKEAETQPHIAMDWNTYAAAANFYAGAGLPYKAFEALNKAEVRVGKKDGTGFNFLISIYAKLGRKNEVLRLWELEKVACKRYMNKDYMNVLESLVKLDEFDEAKKILDKWHASDNRYDFRVPNAIIIGYCDKRAFEGAEAMLEDLKEKEKHTSPNSWGAVAAGYVDKGQMSKALECMKTALSLKIEAKGWKPGNGAVMSLLTWVGEQGSVAEAESFVESLRSVVTVNREMYHVLLRAYIRSCKEVEGLLEKMRADKVDEDEETENILGTRRE